MSDRARRGALHVRIGGDLPRAPGINAPLPPPNILPPTQKAPHNVPLEILYSVKIFVFEGGNRR